MGGACSTNGERRGAYRVLLVKPEGKNHLEDPGVDGRIILDGSSRSRMGEAWTGSIWHGIGTSDGHL